MSFIYLITNKINGKRYVGQTSKTVEERFRDHIENCYTTQNNNRPLYKAIKKYGVSNFMIETLEECSSSIVNEREIYWIKKLGTFSKEYNATLGGDGYTQYDYNAIWLKYQELKNIQQTANYFNCDRRVVRSVINAHGIKNPARKIRKVYQLDKDYKILNKYNSLVAASKAVKGDREGRNGIRTACLDSTKTAYGYKWCFEEDYEKRKYD